MKREVGRPKENSGATKQFELNIKETAVRGAGSKMKGDNWRKFVKCRGVGYSPCSHSGDGVICSFNSTIAARGKVDMGAPEWTS